MITKLLVPASYFGLALCNVPAHGNTPMLYLLMNTQVFIRSAHYLLLCSRRFRSASGVTALRRVLILHPYFQHIMRLLLLQLTHAAEPKASQLTDG